MSNVLYSTNGEGRWWRIQWDEQCNEEVMFRGCCQGTKGHKGVHWCYGPDGSYEWSDNDDDRQHDGAAGMTPPGHKDWISPVDMADKHHLNFRNETEVTDPEIIRRLNDEEVEENASYTRPVVLDQLPKEIRERFEDEKV